jgi:replicative DNA helicase
MRNLFSVIHDDSFGKDEEKIKRAEFIRKGLDARIKQNLTRRFMIIKYINGGIIEGDLLDPRQFVELSNDEIIWVNETISACVKNSYMNDYAEKFMDLCVRFQATDYRFRGPIIKEFENLIGEVQNHFRRLKVEDASEAIFSLRNGIFEECITDIHNEVSSESNKLICGMQGLNEMLSGGFENKNVYLLFGLPGEGKTSTLLNIAYQIKKYNKNYQTKDPTKKPCIVFFSNENTVSQIVRSLFNISSVPQDMSNFTIEDVIKKLKEGGLYLSDESPIDIIIKFKPGMSVDTSYLYTLVEDLEDEGYETICVIQDYIKRIRPVDRTGDLRIDLGNVINDYKNFAAIKQIPVISASQLNRDATKHIDEARKANKADLLRMLGRSNIGESLLILENIDGGFMVAPEFDQDGNKYLGIQRIKARYIRLTDREHVYQPFVKGSKIKLEEDENLAQPCYRDSMRAEDVNIKMAKNSISAYHTNTIKDVDTNVKLLSSENNMFMSGSGYSADTSKAVAYSIEYQSLFLRNPIRKNSQLRTVITKHV